MPTDQVIDDSLLREALRLGGLNTKRQTVDAALAEYIQIATFSRLRRTVGFDSTKPA